MDPQWVKDFQKAASKKKVSRKKFTVKRFAKKPSKKKTSKKKGSKKKKISKNKEYRRGADFGAQCVAYFDALVKQRARKEERMKLAKKKKRKSSKKASPKIHRPKVVRKPKKKPSKKKVSKKKVSKKKASKKKKVKQPPAGKAPPRKKSKSRSNLAEKLAEGEVKRVGRLIVQDVKSGDIDVDEAETYLVELFVELDVAPEISESGAFHGVAKGLFPKSKTQQRQFMHGVARRVRNKREPEQKKRITKKLLKLANEDHYTSSETETDSEATETDDELYSR